MITIAGEALIDLVVDEAGSITAHPGGAPLNVAQTIARLGVDCQFLGRLSADAFGDRLRESLARAGVALAVPEATLAPTSLALATLDDTGAAGYSFYLEGTAAAKLSPADIPDDLLERSEILALGGLGLVIEPLASTLLDLIDRVPAEMTLVLDPNCRPTVIGDLAIYRESLTAFMRRADIVKVSVDDLRLLRPGATAGSAARSLLATGPPAVLVTDGPGPVTVITADAERVIPVPDIDVVDTIGAGDAFVAAFLAGWAQRGMQRAQSAEIEALRKTAEDAVQVAVQACRVKGAGLPADFVWRYAEVDGRRTRAAASS
jgi:fructokinase